MQAGALDDLLGPGAPVNDFTNVTLASPPPPYLRSGVPTNLSRDLAAPNPIKAMPNSTRSALLRWRPLLAAAGVCLLTPSLSAQTDAPRPATPPAPSAEVVQLSPFEVTGDANDTYIAAGTKSLTGLASSLNETPADARILTRTMLEELGGGDVFKSLADHAGLGPTLFGGGSEGQRGMQEGDELQTAMTGRGFNVGAPRRDGFIQSRTSYANSFDVESADVLFGSNNLLYGSGDASGVIVINSKRAYVNRTTGKLTVKFDSEGSNNQTLDFNLGQRRFAFRLNLLKSRDRYYRPLLGLDQGGYQAALTLRPYRWISVFAEAKHYVRAAGTSAGATIRVPVTRGLLLKTGENIDNKETSYITGYGGTELLNGLITYTNQDSLLGPFRRQHWVTDSTNVTVDLTPWRDLACQLRGARELTTNNGVAPLASTFYSPDHPSNDYRDAAGNRIMEWAMNSAIGHSPSWVRTDGIKATIVGRRDLGRWGEHRMSGFYSRFTSDSNSRSVRWYEIDGAGNWVQDRANINNTDSGRIQIPAVWRPIFSPSLPYNVPHWPAMEIAMPNGRRYRRDPSVYPGAVPATAANPWGLSGPTDATGMPTSTAYTWDNTVEEGWGGNFASKFWRGHIDTLISYRHEEAIRERFTTAQVTGPFGYDCIALGLVADTPIRGIRLYANRSTNYQIAFSTTRDIFNRPLPIGSGKSNDVGLKMALWENRLSGSITYYQTEQLNNATTLGAFQNDVDPDGINGRNGGSGFVFSRKSDGLSVSLSAQPTRAWTVVASFTQANGAERETVRLPIFYNDQFNTTTVGGQQVVAIKNLGTGALTPLMVNADPQNPAAGTVPLSIAMLKDPTNPHFAQLDPDSGQILNAVTLGMRTAGVGTGVTGLPISNHQLGFVPPVQEIIVRQAGEKTTGYAENAYSLVNRYQFTAGRLRGLVAGLSTVYRRNFRAYRYTDAAAAGARKTFYYPDRFMNNAFLIYNFRAFPSPKVRLSVQLNVDNLLDRQRIIALPRSTNGVIRYFQEQYSPRKYTLGTSLAF
jgi:hypothetical protein